MLLLNVDLGELPGEPEELYALAHLANVACGGHAGDDASMRAAVALCRAHGTRLGAHPSYPDRAGFGRSAMPMEPAALRAAVADQCARLRDLARDAAGAVAFVKPHGALYHAADADADLAAAVVGGAADALGAAYAMVGPAGGALAAASRAAGLRYLREGFADRGIRADGSLVPRGQPGALVTDPEAAARQATALARSGRVETLCVHGDTPGALAIARAVRRAIDALARVGPGP
jgi:UPF0271 protein